MLLSRHKLYLNWYIAAIVNVFKIFVFKGGRSFPRSPLRSYCSQFKIKAERQLLVVVMMSLLPLIIVDKVFLRDFLRYSPDGF